jgi:formylglycine-generating enzyme required for sulfatase activity
MKLVLIPAGEFLMGSAESARALPEPQSEGEYPQHRVRLNQPFYLGVHELTQQQYERVMGVHPSYSKGPQHPVQNVSWDDAVKFCDTLSALPEEWAAGRTYRLPTEAEWEYACRAGTTTHYSFGDDPAVLGDYAWFQANASEGTHTVGQKRPNAWGLYDMHGNLWEWCADWFGEDYYEHSTVDDPTGPATGTVRMHRGGCWLAPASYCRSAYRFTYQPPHGILVGFRVAAVPSAGQASPTRGSR